MLCIPLSGLCWAKKTGVFKLCTLTIKAVFRDTLIKTFITYDKMWKMVVHEHVLHQHVLHVPVPVHGHDLQENERHPRILEDTLLLADEQISP